jgi:DNA repair exonuclease SbcCD ATPase subunit
MSRQRELHDNLMAIRAKNPALIDVAHDANCPYCSSNQGGSMTDEELRAILASEKAPLLAKIAELEAAATANKVEVFLADSTAEYVKEIEELRLKLDTAVLEKAKIADDFEAYKAEIEEVETNRKALEEFTARREERIGKVKEVEERADSWAAMPDEEFASLCGDYALQSGAKPKTDKPPHQTAMVASRNHGDPMDATKELFRGVVLDRYITKKTTPVSPR